MPAFRRGARGHIVELYRMRLWRLLAPTMLSEMNEAFSEGLTEAAILARLLGAQPSDLTPGAAEYLLFYPLS